MTSLCDTLENGPVAGDDDLVDTTLAQLEEAYERLSIALHSEFQITVP